ncbi:MAG: glycosyltransferase [candidate division WOR-3 bacterium]
MPAYNAEKYISEAIESILNQTFKDFEFIIVDDASTDKTWEIIQEYARKDERIKSLKNDINMKIAKTLNYGIQHASGLYIARMDADDISLPERFELQVNFMNNNPDVVVLGGGMIIIDEDGKPISKRSYYSNDEEIRRHIFLFSPFCHPTIFIRKDAFDNTGGYDPYYESAEDYELYSRLGRLGKFANLKEFIIKYRLTPNSVTAKKI